MGQDNCLGSRDAPDSESRPTARRTPRQRLAIGGARLCLIDDEVECVKAVVRSLNRFKVRANIADGSEAIGVDPQYSHALSPN